MTTEKLAALRGSVERLRRIVGPLDDAAVEMQAYTSEWTIAQVMSHIGSGAVIIKRRLEDRLAGNDTPGDFPPSVWAAWDAKAPRQQTDDALEADAAALARFESVEAHEREAFDFAMGPIAVDFSGFVGLRLNEHAFHTWDIEVALDPTAAIPRDAAEFVVDNLALTARWTAKPASELAVVVRTHEPTRTFDLHLSPGGSSLAPAPADQPADLELPAEAFARLVYGRLDPAHTPAGVKESGLLATLRAVFPGP